MCGRLIKGYGATNERGKENLLHVLDHLAVASRVRSRRRARARRSRAARVAALADEAGQRARPALVRHGAPAAAGQGAADPLGAQRPGRPVEIAARSSEPAP